VPVREAVWLIRHGFPPDVAFALPEEYRTAFGIIASEQGGRDFDWNTLEFKD